MHCEEKFVEIVKNNVKVDKEGNKTHPKYYTVTINILEYKFPSSLGVYIYILFLLILLNIWFGKLLFNHHI